MRRQQPQSRRKSPRSAPKHRLSVSIIGAGRMGTAMAIALQRNGYAVDLLVAAHARTAQRAAKLVGRESMAVAATDLGEPRNRERLAKCSLILISTPDDVIGEVAKQMASLIPKTPVAKVALHTSGALTSQELQPLRSSGFAIGCLHPLISISNSESGAEALRRAHFSVEGDHAAVRLGKRIARDLGISAFEIKPEVKPLYHAAALMASPNLTALEDIAFEMLGRCGLSASQARRVLLPLIQSTVDNLLHENPAQALTGTFKRRDVATVRKHLLAISAEDLLDALQAYIVLGRRSLKLSNGKAADRAGEIERLLTTTEVRTRRSQTSTLRQSNPKSRK